MTQWYAVYARPREEQLAQEHLSRQGFEAYLPRYLKQRNHARRVDSVPMPLFPRYLFVRFDIADFGWRVIRSTRGVVDLVRNGSDPIDVPEPIIAGVKAREDENGYVLLGKNLGLARGDRFRIGGGAFFDQIAVFEAKRDEDRVIALLSLLGRQVTVQVPIGYVAPIS